MAAASDDRIIELQHPVLGGYRLLQTLIGIRLRAVTDPESVRHLTWLSDVTAAMDLISRRIMADGPLDFAAYLDDVAAFWTRACQGRPVRIQTRGQAALLPESHILPLAIIVHELVSNAVRHAFPGDQGGSIAVAFSRSRDGVSLVVRDSGVGAQALTPGDGLALVEGLVQHLGGFMSIETAQGRGVGIRIRLMTDATQSH